ncbi:MAG: hypothetical protein H6834_05335, partial [Planctomycetes bacterium]|nr:hypothetical protein [Planctomycetota bacterium]
MVSLPFFRTALVVSSLVGLGEALICLIAGQVTTTADAIALLLVGVATLAIPVCLLGVLAAFVPWCRASRRDHPGWGGASLALG